MEAAFEIVSPPDLQQVAPFRFVHHKVRGPYTPWTRVQTLDTVAEALEKLGVDRTGPAFGIYHDLPYSTRETDHWSALLGFPVADAATVPPSPALRVMDVPPLDVIGLSYRGDLASFPGALQFLLEWSVKRGIDVRGPLLERFHVSNALTGQEERDVYVALQPLPGR